ncbi:MAG: phosphatase PAP2 family protein [Candidatus Woesearchaeota archaeon]
MSAERFRKEKMFLILVYGIVFLLSFYIDSYAESVFKILRSPLLDFLMAVFSSYLIVGAAVLIYLILFFRRKERKAANRMLTGFLLTFIASFLIKMLVARVRPSGIAFIPLLNIPDFSFPSMHSALAFSTLPVVERHFKKIRGWWMLGCFLVMISRLYFGVHYLSDVVGGMLLGLVVGSIFSK